ncbi:MAG: type II secretion system protein [Puniceicoccales bacterium]
MKNSTIPICRNPKQPAFTLIELLAVFAIIGILAAIILPVVGNIKSSAMEATGMSNMRQLGLAYIGVAQEHNGRLPSWTNLDGDNIDRWDREVNAYLGGDIDYNIGDIAPAFKDPLAVAEGLITENTAYHFAPLGGITRGGESRLGKYRIVANYKRPERQILLADSGVDSNLSPAGDLYLVDGGFQTWEGFRSSNISGDGMEPIDPGNGEKGNIRWYKGEAKFFFLDGHVEKRAQEEVLKINVNPLYP